jgi:diadenylate cyclase
MIRWQSGFDFVVLAGAIYLVLRWGRDARAFRVTFAILGLAAGAVLARQLDLLITSWVLGVASLAALVLVLSVFQDELRHALTRLDVVAWLLRRRQGPRERLVQVISTAAFSLAQARRGALVVLSGRDPVDELVDGGVPLGGEVSQEILEAIFRKVSPVHDGAAIVQGERISRVGTILPLTQRRDVPRGYGTRHRAAMGLAERCDAIVIVVSEERGQVSLAHGGEIATIQAPEDLARRVRELRAPLAAGAGMRVRRILLVDLPLRAVALGLAGLLWGVSFLLAGSSVRSVTVGVEFRNVPADLEIAQLSAQVVQVQLRGSPWVLDSFRIAPLAARFELAGTREGTVTLPVQPDTLGLPPGLEIERVSPPTVTVQLVPRRPPPIR